MKRLFLTLLCLLSFAAHAEWLLMTPSSDTEKIYIDKSTIKRNGDIVKSWILFDYVKVQRSDDDFYQSSKTYTEFNCAEEMLRITYDISYAQHNGEGRVVSTNNNPGKWSPAVPGTSGMSVLKSVCNPDNK